MAFTLTYKILNRVGKTKRSIAKFKLIIGSEYSKFIGSKYSKFAKQREFIVALKWVVGLSFRQDKLYTLFSKPIDCLAGLKFSGQFQG